MPLGPDGSGVRGVLSISSHEDGTSHGFCPIASLPVLVLGKILPFGILSVYDFVKVAHDDIIYLSCTAESWWCLSTGSSGDLSPKLLELGAGIGGMGTGSFLKGYPVVSVDINPLACTHLERNSHGTVLRMDLTHPSSAKLIHQQVGESPGTVTFGFPCQPFSSLFPKEGEQCQLAPWPLDSPFRVVGDLFTNWGVWDESAEQELQLR